MNIKILGAHAALESLNTKCISLLIDDVLALDAGALTSTLSLSDQRKLRAILCTHGHWDHVKDVRTMACYRSSLGETINVYSIPSVKYFLYLMFQGTVFGDDLMERPPENPIVKFTEIELLKTQQIEGYSVLAVPVNHPVPAVGYQVTSPDGKVLFYSGDTGTGLANCWERISPQMLFIEATMPNRLEERARLARHLTPALLKQELAIFREVKGYLPQIVTLHFDPTHKEEIQTEIEAAAKELDHPITMGYEGMQLHL